MKTKNKLFLILLTVFIMLSLGSCSNKSTGPNTEHHIGDIITFGAYDWQILDIQDGRALVVSESILEQRRYHTFSSSITWADCSLRAYLNGEFYNSNAFTNADRARIVQVTNVNENNQWYGTNGGANTQARIFLLSIAEVVQYFGDSGQLDNRPLGAWSINDQYNTNRVVTFNGSALYWWLRSPGAGNSYASSVTDVGYLFMAGGSAEIRAFGIRPALWLNL